MVLKARSTESARRERMFMVEKGLEIPPELLERQKEPRPSDFRVGRVWLLILGTITVFVGLGVLIGLTIQEGFRTGAAGLIPLIIGLGFIAAERLIARYVVRT